MVVDETLKKQIWEALGTVEDPEIGLTLTELGLIYDATWDEELNVSVIMTFTSMACPYGPQLQAMSQAAVAKVEGVRSVNVEVVFNPPWDPNTMASEDAKMVLGIV